MVQTIHIYVEAIYPDPARNSSVPDACQSLANATCEQTRPVEHTPISGPSTQQNACSHPHGSDIVSERLRTFLSVRVRERVTLKELSRFLGYSEKYASHVFQRCMGRPFSTHLKQLRLDRAISMLREKGHTISKIAESICFSDAFAFSHFVKRAVGCSPMEYRRQQLRQADRA